MNNEIALTIETSGEKSFGPCECCGAMTKRIWGFVYEADAALAAYFVEWTPGHEASSATFDLILGAWGDGTDNSARKAVSLEFRRLESGPAFMVIDATMRPTASSTLTSEALTRNAVVGTAIASKAYRVCDAVYLEEPRLDWLRN
jgi:hypothetical protein